MYTVLKIKISRKEGKIKNLILLQENMQPGSFPGQPTRLLATAQGSYLVA
jgi:hypothetical protein